MKVDDGDARPLQSGYEGRAKDMDPSRTHYQTRPLIDDHLGEVGVIGFSRSLYSFLCVGMSLLVGHEVVVCGGDICVASALETVRRFSIRYNAGDSAAWDSVTSACVYQGLQICPGA